MGRATLRLILAVLASGLVSCDRHWSVPVDWKWVWVGSTTAWYAARDQNLGAVVWVDRPGEPSGQASQGHVQGQVRTSTGGIVIHIDCQFTEDGSTFSIDGKQYDLSRGSVFLVSTHQVPPAVTQLSANITAYPAAPTAVQAMTNNIPEVAAFVKGADAGVGPATGPIGPQLPGH